MSSNRHSTEKTQALTPDEMNQRLQELLAENEANQLEVNRIREEMNKTVSEFQKTREETIKKCEELIKEKERKEQQEAQRVRLFQPKEETTKKEKRSSCTIL